MSKIMYDENYTAGQTGNECWCTAPAHQIGDEGWDTTISRMMEHDDINTEFKSKSTAKRETIQRGTPVNHPSHYNQGGIECIDAIKAATANLTGEEAFCTGNALKYLWRWKEKNGIEDLDKAIWYINRIKTSFYMDKH